MEAELSGLNLPNWKYSLDYSQIHYFERELAETLDRLEPCTQSEAQISLAPIVKRCAKGQSVILVERQNEMEKGKKVEKDVDRFMHTLSERTEKRRADSTERSPAGKHPFQESFDEDARKQAAKNGFVPGVLVLWKGNMHRAWRIESIRCDRGCDKAMVCDPEWGPVTQHKEYEISELVLAEPAHGPEIEEVPAEPLDPVVEEVLEE